MKLSFTIALCLSLTLQAAPTFAFSVNTVQEQSVERNAGAGWRCIWRGKRAKHRCHW